MTHPSRRQRLRATAAPARATKPRPPKYRKRRRKTALLRAARAAKAEARHTAQTDKRAAKAAKLAAKKAAQEAKAAQAALKRTLKGGRVAPIGQKGRRAQQRRQTRATQGLGLAKPPYQIPGLAALHALPQNGFVVASTFSGCGGSSLGYRWAGYRVAWANEFVPAARAVYEANFPNTIVDPRDIRKITAAEILDRLQIQPGALDILDGSPPCAAFSSSGRREKGWGKVRKYSDTKQRVDDLFFEFTRLLADLQPKVFLAENVPGLAAGRARAILNKVLDACRHAGYRVDARIVDASVLGVPQYRRRLFIQGVRLDLDKTPVWPAALPYRYSVLDAWRDVPHEEPVSIARYAIGRAWRDQAPLGKGHPDFFNLIRVDLARPCPTVLAKAGERGIASIVHPTECRKFTIPELRRICGFPDDFQLTGKPAQQWERLGRAVPPPMMMRLASAIRDQILEPLRAR